MKLITIRYHISFLVLCFMCMTAYALPQRPEPPRLVNDLADIFTAEQENTLESILVAFDDSTSNQIAVITTKDLEGYEPADYATRIGLEWGVGSEKFDNGIVVLIKPKDSTPGQVFIATGYGLEGAVPDAYAKRIINNEMIPHFMENDYYGGAEAACETLMKLASGEISELREGDDDGDLIYVAIFFIALIFVLIIIAAVANENNGKGGKGGGSSFDDVFTTGPVIIRRPGSSWGSSGGFGGGFSGGLGGGFGGFGGGSFGGGGAGGSW